MISQNNDELVDSIVAGVLERLRGGSAPSGNQASDRRQPAGRTTRSDTKSNVVTLAERVITQSLLEEKLNGAKAVRFTTKAILTPTARDYLRSNSIDWEIAATAPGQPKASAAGHWAALIVRATPAVERVVADLLPDARTELLGCPNDAASIAIGEISRGGIAQAIVFAEQSHRAACFANRHQAVKAVSLNNIADVANVRKQLRANVWCVDPSNRTYFELRNIVKAVRGG